MSTIQINCPHCGKSLEIRVSAAKISIEFYNCPGCIKPFVYVLSRGPKPLTYCLPLDPAILDLKDQRELLLAIMTDVYIRINAEEDPDEESTEGPMDLSEGPLAQSFFRTAHLISGASEEGDGFPSSN